MFPCVKEQDENSRRRHQESLVVCVRMKVGCGKQTRVGGDAQEQLHVVGGKIKKITTLFLPVSLKMHLQPMRKAKETF